MRENKDNRCPVCGGIIAGTMQNDGDGKSYLHSDFTACSIDYGTKRKPTMYITRREEAEAIAGNAMSQESHELKGYNISIKTGGISIKIELDRNK